jgi:hypothetical protein
MRFVLGLMVVSCAFAQQIDYARQVSNKPDVDVREYEWSRRNGAGASGTLTSSGSKTITLTPCPKGLAGSDSVHYVYISGGSGTAEAALITGGSCTGGSTSGTIIVTTANTHSGAWTVRSATDGIDEALRIATPIWGRVLLIPRTGGYAIRAGVLVPFNTTLECASTEARRDRYQLNSTDGCVLQIYAGKGATTGQALMVRSGVTLRGLSFFYPEQVNTDTPFQYPPTIRLQDASANNVILRDLLLENSYIGIDATGSHERLEILNVSGNPLNLGISIDQNLHMDVLSNINFTASWSLPSTGLLPEYSVGTAMEYTSRNGTAFRFGRMDFFSASKLTAHGFKTGIEMVTGSPVTGGSYGMIDSYLCDACQFGVTAATNGIAGSGIHFVNSEIVLYSPFAAANSMSALYLPGTANGPIYWNSGKLAGISDLTGVLIYSEAAGVHLVTTLVNTVGNNAALPPIQLGGDATFSDHGSDMYLTNSSTATPISPYNFITYQANFTGTPATLSGTRFRGTPAIFSGVTPTPFTHYINVTTPSGFLNLFSVEQLYGVTFSSLGTATTGLMKFCGDCNVATPCTGGGSGAWAFANGGQWKCTF